MKFKKQMTMKFNGSELGKCITALLLIASKTPGTFISMNTLKFLD